MTEDDEAWRAATVHYLESANKGERASTADNMYHDAVLEFPQSGERLESLVNFRAWREQHPAHGVRSAPRFHVPFGEVADVGGRTPEAFRQLASRTPPRQTVLSVGIDGTRANF